MRRIQDVSLWSIFLRLSLKSELGTSGVARVVGDSGTGGKVASGSFLRREGQGLSVEAAAPELDEAAAELEVGCVGSEVVGIISASGSLSNFELRLDGTALSGACSKSRAAARVRFSPSREDVELESCPGAPSADGSSAGPGSLCGAAGAADSYSCREAAGAADP